MIPQAVNIYWVCSLTCAKGIKVFAERLEERGHNALVHLQLLAAPLMVISQASAPNLCPTRARWMVSVQRVGFAEGLLRVLSQAREVMAHWGHWNQHQLLSKLCVSR